MISRCFAPIIGKCYVLGIMRFPKAKYVILKKDFSNYVLYTKRGEYRLSMAYVARCLV